jgi:hypothetical protein
MIGFRVSPRLPAARRVFALLGLPLFLIALALVVFAWRDQPGQSDVRGGLEGCYVAPAAGKLELNRQEVRLLSSTASRLIATEGNDKGGTYILTVPGLIYAKPEGGAFFSPTLLRDATKSFRIIESKGAVRLIATAESGEEISFSRVTC